MLSLKDYRLMFVAAGFVGALLIISPLVGVFVRLPAGESFTEFYVLGPGRMLEDYPFNVKPGESYTVYLGVVNHVGSSAYYVSNVKLRNQDEPLPNSTAGTSSPLASLYEYRVFLADGESWEAPLTLSVGDVTVSGSTLSVGRVILNGVEVEVDKQAGWDQANSGFYFEVFAELWRYDAVGGMSFDSRYVHLWLNVTATA